MAVDMMDFRDSVFGTIRDLMRNDPRVMVVTNDMGAMLLNEIREEFPEHVINIGIAEQNMMSFAGGLAQTGRIVFTFGIGAHVISRAWEQLKLDICVLNLPVVTVGVGPGLAYGPDGPTHHATEDVALVRTLPNMSIFNPCDPVNTAQCTRLAYECGGPAYLRLDKEKVDAVYSADDDLNEGLKVIGEGSVALISTGVLTHRALAAAKILEDQGIASRVIDVFRLKPLNTHRILNEIKDASHVFCIEEHNTTAGLGSAVATALSQSRTPRRLHLLGLPDEYLLGSASRAWAHETYGLSPKKIADSVLQECT